jgi:hypothetical protein
MIAIVGFQEVGELKHTESLHLLYIFKKAAQQIMQSLNRLVFGFWPSSNHPAGL